MKQKNEPAGTGRVPFLKCYLPLLGAFDASEVVFMLYMADLTRLRGAGYRILRGKRAHLACTGLGLRVFNRCVEKTTRMGLLTRESTEGMYDYLWDMGRYERLVGMLSRFRDVESRRNFCLRVFENDGRGVDSVSEEEMARVAQM